MSTIVRSEESPGRRADLVQDESRLERLGYEQELKRNFSKFETFGVAFSIMGVLPSIASTIFYSLPYGGPVSMIWGWLISTVFITTIGLAMADLASSMPTSGGLFYWTSSLAPAKYRRFLSWFVAYNSFLGNVAATCSLAWACSGIFFAGVTLQNPDFSPSVGASFGLFVGILALCGVLCAYGTTLLARLQTPSVCLNVAISFVTIIGLPIARRGQLNTGAYTFGHFENLTGYVPGFAFILSFLSPVWTICSFDCAVSISEEASNAAIAVPYAIVGSIVSAGGLGTLILIILSLTMGTDIAMLNDTDQPLAQIYLMAFGKNGATAIWTFMCIAEFMMTASIMFPASRQAFAMVRDGALPCSKYLYRIDTWSGTPTRTVWLVVACCIPLGALGFADEAAINAIFALAITGPYVAYMIPIACRLIFHEPFFPGPFYLGRWSRPVAWVSVVWMVFAAIIFCFPADINPNAASMNYAAVVAVGVWCFATVYWFLPGIGGKTFFHGPPTEKPDADFEVEQVIVRHEQAKKDLKNAAGPRAPGDDDEAEHEHERGDLDKKGMYGSGGSAVSASSSSNAGRS